MTENIEIEVVYPYRDIKLKKDMTVGDKLAVSSKRLEELQEAEKKNNVQLVKVIKTDKKES